MVKLSAPLALLAVAVAGVVAQEPAPAASSPAASSPAPSAAPTSAAPQGGEGDGAQVVGGGSTAVCSALFGDPKAGRLGDCSASQTVVPPYNLNSLVSYMVGGYEHNRADDAHVSDVAEDLANSVVKYYPTVTQSKDVIVYAMYTGLLSSIKASVPGFSPVDKIKPPPGMPASAERLVVPGAVAVAAAVIGGAVLL